MPTGEERLDPGISKGMGELEIWGGGDGRSGARGKQNYLPMVSPMIVDQTFFADVGPKALVKQ